MPRFAFSRFPSFVAACILAASICSAAPGDDPVRAYNVLLLVADDLNDAVLGFGGHRQSLTPRLDQLGREGVRFLNAHANAPICGPSRASFLTGVHPLASGYYGYRQQENHWRKNPALADAVTVMEHFRANGYEVFGTGKIFHNGHEDNSVWRGEDGELKLGVSSNFGPYPWDGAYRTPWGDIGWQPHPDLPAPLRKFWGQGFGPLSQIPEYEPDPDAGVPGYRGWVLDGEPFRYKGENDRDLMPDESSARYVAELLGQEREQPFFIACGFYRPHTPLYAPLEYFERFPLETIELPPFRKSDLEDVAEAFRPQLPSSSARAVGLQKFQDVMDAGGEGMWKRWVQAYLACVAFVDDQVGTVLDALEASPHGRDTLVVFISDHGYHMGEKRYLFKNSLWEESSRVPFIVRIPGQGREGAEVVDPVSLVDLYPSLIEWCGLPDRPNQGRDAPPLDGRSLADYTLKGALPPQTGEYEGALIAIAGERPLEVNEPGAPEDQHWSLRTRHYRYILANTGEEELYDHRSDPHEWENLAAHPAYGDRKAALRRSLLAAIGKERSETSE